MSLFFEYMSTIFMRNKIISEDIQNCENILLFTFLILNTYNQWRNLKFWATVVNLDKRSPLVIVRDPLANTRKKTQKRW